MSRTVLLVSSNKTLVMYMGVLIKRMGFGMLHAGTSAEALSLTAIVQPDVAVVDGDLAALDGLENLERSRAGGPSVPPVIMLVGVPTEEAERRCMIIGASTVVSKPIRVDDLHHALQECLFGPSGIVRRHVRARANVRVTVYHDGSEMELMTESLSAGGAFISHDNPLKTGTLVDVFLPLGETECLFMTGRVVYNQKPCQNAFGICPGFAVEFVGPSAEETRTLSEFVASYMTEDIHGLHYHEVSRPELTDGPEARFVTEGVYAAMQSYAGKTKAAGRRTV